MYWRGTEAHLPTGIIVVSFEPKEGAFVEKAHKWESEPKGLTSSGRTEPGGFGRVGIDFGVKDDLLDASSEDVAGEADRLLSPDERVCQVIRHRAKAFVPEHGEFVHPCMIDVTRVAQPVDRGLGMVAVWDGCHNDSDLRRRESAVSDKNTMRKGRCWGVS